MMLSSRVAVAAGWPLPFPIDPWLLGGILVLAGIVFLLWLAWHRPPSRDVVARLKGITWNRHTFCQHFLITGATGSGKTLSGILALLFEVFKHQPRFGGLCVDIKGVLHQQVHDMATHFGRANDILLLEVRPATAPADWQPRHRFNLVGDRSIPFSTYARCVVDTAVALGSRNEQSFFRRAAQVNIGKALEALDALGFQVTLENAHNLLVNPDDTRAVLTQLESGNHPALAEHFRNYLAQPQEQLGGIKGTVDNYLANFTLPPIAEVFCRDSTFDLADVDQGKLICLSLPQRYQTERRFVGTFLKLLFYTHALARFDAPKSKREQDNLLVLIADECQQFVTASEDGLSDHNVVDLVREAGVAVIAATQSTTSLIPALGAAQAQVFTLNLRNRLIFTAADQVDARASAEFLGEVTKRQRSVTHGDAGRSESWSEREEYWMKPHKLRGLRKHRCILLHCTRRPRKVLLPPRQPDGKIPRWFHWWNVS
ncbi:MAG: type IV secretion system DNA-binding domain-containing protein [Verrucomicrobiales bacterium]|nr:type IV secretion system DNA-binding domain-containing protein [Verrucomicrobiales bacterium]